MPLRWDASFPEPTPFNGDPEPEDIGRGPLAYRCVDCSWTGRGVQAFDHHTTTGHAVRGREWPPTWPNCQFSGADASGRNRRLMGVRRAG